jgi:CII-binding regulator of phage lambda lysogenization HflD
MKTAKEMILVEDLKYWRSERPDEWTMDRFISKAMKLEQELSRLKESQTQLCNRVDKAEADKAELVEFVKEMNDLGKLSPMRLSDYTDVIYHGSLALLNKYTDKPDAL